MIRWILTTSKKREETLTEPNMILTLANSPREKTHNFKLKLTYNKALTDKKTYKGQEWCLICSKVGMDQGMTTRLHLDKECNRQTTKTIRWTGLTS